MIELRKKIAALIVETQSDYGEQFQTAEWADDAAGRIFDLFEEWYGRDIEQREIAESEMREMGD